MEGIEAVELAVIVAGFLVTVMSVSCN